MTERTWIGLGRWMAMSPEQRGQFRQACGGQFGIDINDLSDGTQADYDEYREEMSLGGRPYDPNEMQPQTSTVRKV